MNNTAYDKKYWEERYAKGEANWDIGRISSPLKEYIDQLSDNNIRILIPGCGNAHEAQYLHEQGFRNVFVIDLAQNALDNLLERYPEFPSENLISGDYFAHEGQYDLILEQTFFSSLEPRLRDSYARKSCDLLVPCGKLSGVLFDFELDGGPPYGGTIAEYRSCFNSYFNTRTLEPCYNSIESRKGIELFITLERVESIGEWGTDFKSDPE